MLIKPLEESIVIPRGTEMPVNWDDICVVQNEKIQFLNNIRTSCCDE